MSMPRVRRYGRPRPTHSPTSTTRLTMASFYGTEGLAAAPGTVVDVVDHLPDEVPGNCLRTSAVGERWACRLQPE